MKSLCRQSKQALFLLFLIFIVEEGCSSLQAELIPTDEQVPAQDSVAAFESYIFDLNNDGQPDSITLFGLDAEKESFLKIKISLTGNGSKSFQAKNGWSRIDESFAAKNKNGVSSEFLNVAGKSGSIYLLLFGKVDDAGYREEFNIIWIKGNEIRLILDDRQENDIEIPVEIADLDRDGKEDFVWSRIRETIQEVDSLDADIGSYAPYYVYTLDDDFKLNLALTKSYNEQHYVWAGFDSTGNYQVIYPHNGGKPKILELK